ncbi:prepilin-type N-terminal cleavage/methylation domain-containing protein [bacterium]|nr:prepilin-type N-terminal cleavage/methylation domain-containing protein [bacterium]
MPSRRAFTLIELLASIAIIGLLAGLLVPLTGAARNKARAAQCLSNMRQVGAATLLYVNEHRGRLPSISHLRSAGVSYSWTETLQPYVGPDFIGRCPSRPDHIAKVTYGWNDLLVSSVGEGLSFGVCRTPSATLMLAEIPEGYTTEHVHFSGAARGVTPAFFRTNVRVDVHGSASNYLFVDGHVSLLGWTDIQTRLAASQSTLVYP